MKYRFLIAMGYKYSTLFLCLLGATASTALAERFAITNARVFDGTGAPAAVRTVIVNGSKIEAVGAALPLPAGLKTIDGTGMTVLPGLFDLHTHIQASAGRVSADWNKSLAAYLRSGVTSIVELSSYPEQFEAMRRIAADRPSPHVFFAARFSTPGGHGAEGGRGDFHTQIVQTPVEARAAVRLVLKYKPDLLKVFSDGWRYGTGVDMTSMDEATLTALVDEAHKGGVKVVTHTVTLEKAKVAARSGVDVLIHGIGNHAMDDELLALMKQKGTGYVPTLAVYEPRGRRTIPDGQLRPVLEPALMAEKAAADSRAQAAARNARWKTLMTNSRKFKEAGLLHGAGTDAGMAGTYHGWATLHELELMVEAGLSPAEALQAATSSSAKYMGVDGERGTIAEGKIADLLLVKGDPTAKIADIFQIEKVFLGGEEVVLAAIEQDIAIPGLTPLPAVKAAGNLDDFESSSGRSQIDTLWLNNTDGGHDHAQMSYGRTRRESGGHALTVMCQMPQKPGGLCSMLLPLSKGSVEPVDASSFAGIEFEVRGEGEYKIQIPARSIRDRRYFQAPFSAEPQWQKRRIPFGELTRIDLFNLEFLMQRGPGEKTWLEIDNVRFYASETQLQ